MPVFFYPDKYTISSPSSDTEKSENSLDSPHLGEIKRMRKQCVPGTPPFFACGRDEAKGFKACLPKNFFNGYETYFRPKQCFSKAR